MRSPNAVVEPVVATVRMATQPNGLAHSVDVVLHCHVTLSDPRGAVPPPARMTIERSVVVDAELQAQVELLFSMLRRRVGLDYGEA